jgi:predicted dehydrogenase
LPSIKAVKKYLDDENLGKIYNVTANVGQYLPSWRSDKNYKDSVSANKSLGGGALLELSHELDYLFWLFGKLMLKYSWLRTSDELGIDVEDIADLVLVSKDNVYINVHMDFIQKSTYRNCEIIAEKGRLEWDLMSNKVILHAEQGSSIIYSDPSYDMNNMYLDMLRTFENDSMVYSNSLGTLKSSSDIIKLVDKAKKTNQWKKIN